MPRGPLPSPTRRRTNAPTIPTTVLPAAGRKGSIPKVPAHVVLGDAGRAWWRWAWRTPQAAGWDAGALMAVARRAWLEDQLAAVSADKAGALAGQMLRLDHQFGLTPKAMADLRWTIERAEKPAAAGVVVKTDRWDRLGA